MRLIYGQSRWGQAEEPSAAIAVPFPPEDAEEHLGLRRLLLLYQHRLRGGGRGCGGLETPSLWPSRPRAAPIAPGWTAARAVYYRALTQHVIVIIQEKRKKLLLQL